ncbi:hypothetical protein [Streptomyces longwoodensis]|nr:hypothetical protein OG416_38510 [Streptomyces longwoodensis]
MRQPSENARSMTVSVDEALIAAEDGLIAHIRQHAALISQATYRVPDDWT